MESHSCNRDSIRSLASVDTAEDLTRLHVDLQNEIGLYDRDTCDLSISREDNAKRNALELYAPDLFPRRRVDYEQLLRRDHRIHDKLSVRREFDAIRPSADLYLLFELVRGSVDDVD